ncbi:MAG: RluA family pseudouridine synthase, partial [Muribaculaceae bacterium]|nr:RluA family pseudouridine synthase [Muribaculaceae bacterium]
CAPKLLNHAFNHGLHPLCMAEFWVGQSPLGEVRHHGHFYPACRGKCLPLLQFMLQGLDVEKNTLELPPQVDDVNVVYEDEWILIADKPAGMLTVPGKTHEATSVLDIVKRLLPGATGPLIVHRLDQSTSGLVMVAKTKEVHKSLQSQFADRRIGKIYIALLNAVPACDHGVIDLPLCPNPYDRPRQMVSIEHGKRAVTEFKVLEVRGNRALVEFKPLTGRTHQLRVHASHPQGLNCPIVGDMLYGTASDRLYLHALSLSFTHPITGKHITVTSTLHPF